MVVKVSDNGEGIKPEFQKSIFLPFKTLKNKSLTNSSGLGLAICKNILDKANNSIWLESDGKNGCDFYFTLAK